MSTALATHSTTLAKPLFLRFLWKEYRMLRGFWLAVFVLTVIEQLVSTLLVYDQRLVPNWMFASAWGAAALYAVGAAITLFSAEREEQTHDFLVQLPGRWLPMFAAKVLLAILSALVLALCLSLVGWFMAGFRWPTETPMRETLAIAGVAILEATVWGLLFSLWMKQPLLAAILSMAAASIGAQLAVGVASHVSQAFTTEAYSRAAPHRLLLCLGVLLVDVWLASRWLKPAASASQGFWKRRVPRDAANPLLAQGAKGKDAEKSLVRRRMFARLLWQTWQESWGTMLATIPISLLMMFGVALTMRLSGMEELTQLLCPLILPALFGALVFRADQRSGHRQFLVAHAGRPRYVWLARQSVWLSTLVLLGAGLLLAGVFLAATGFHDELKYALQYQEYGALQSAWTAAWQVQSTSAKFWQIHNLSWCALLAAYGLGQLCSMLLSREVLAGFLSLLLAIILTAWTFLVGCWGLSPWWYVLPIALLTLWATWLRAPDWILGRNSFSTWLKPAVAIVLPLGLLLTTLPEARMLQIAWQPFEQDYKFLQEPLATSLQSRQASTAAARETATAYEQLAASIETLPPQEIIEQALVLSQRPACQFASEATLAGNHLWSELFKLKTFLLDDADQLATEGQLETAWLRHLAVARLEGQIRQGQRSSYVQHFSRREQQLVSAVLRWAQRPEQTSQNLKDAIVELQEVYKDYPDPREAVLADHLWIRDILLDKQPPTFLTQEHYQTTDYLPFLANKLPWERQRALRAVDLLTMQNLNYVDAVSYVVRGGDVWKARGRSKRYALSEFLQSRYDDYDVRRIEPLCEGDWDTFVRMQETAAQCRTSYLVTEELSRRGDLSDYLLGWIDAQIAQQGLLTQLALLAYRLDHEAYPETLEELTPDYLAWLPRDPYTRQPFEYRPAGLDLPLDRRHDVNDVAAGTPLFWSSNFMLTQKLSSEIAGRNNEGQDTPDPVVDEFVFVFEPTGIYWSYQQNLVFLLPKF